MSLDDFKRRKIYMFIRNNYLSKIKPWISKPLIKILTGMRRTGKSTLLRQIADELRLCSSHKVIELNLELLEWEHLRDYHALHDYIITQSAGQNAAVCIDEIQFFDEGIVNLCIQLADSGKRVIASGLDQDFKGEPFGPSPNLMAAAEIVDKITAICVKCGNPATRTQRLINGEPAHYLDPIILVGATESYEARCRKCHQVPGKFD